MKDNDIHDIINNVVKYEPNELDISSIESFAEKYKDKSEEDIFVEIIKVNNEMEDKISEEEYERIFEKLESIRPMLSEEQNNKLNKILEILNKDK